MKPTTLIRVMALVIGLAASALVGCAGDAGSRRPSAAESYERQSIYDRQYPRRQYGPWDMQNQNMGTQPGSTAPPGPPTWYGCPQQAANCY